MTTQFASFATLDISHCIFEFGARCAFCMWPCGRSCVFSTLAWLLATKGQLFTRTMQCRTHSTSRQQSIVQTSYSRQRPAAGSVQGRDVNINCIVHVVVSLLLLAGPAVGHGGLTKPLPRNSFGHGKAPLPLWPRPLWNASAHDRALMTMWTNYFDVRDAPIVMLSARRIKCMCLVRATDRRASIDSLIKFACSTVHRVLTDRCPATQRSRSTTLVLTVIPRTW
jgi:hypothetical protein